MNNLLPQPHQTDEGAEGAGHHKAALQAVGQQVLPAEDEHSRSSLLKYPSITIHHTTTSTAKPETAASITNHAQSSQWANPQCKLIF